MIITGLEKKLGAFFLNLEHLRIPGPGIYGLIGPNGCGKSTTARLIMGIISPDRGIIDYEGLEPTEITLLSQKPYMMDDTVYKNLVYPLALRKTKIDKKLCDEYLAKIGLLERRDQRARSLSSGERQKLAFMRAVIFKPRLIIVDEALTDLDMDSLDQAEGLILSIQKNDPVIWIIISHQLPHVRRLCGYLFFMNQGRIEVEGQAAELFANPRHPFLARFLQHEALTVEGQQR